MDNTGSRSAPEPILTILSRNGAMIFTSLSLALCLAVPAFGQTEAAPDEITPLENLTLPQDVVALNAPLPQSANASSHTKQNHNLSTRQGQQGQNDPSTAGQVSASPLSPEPAVKPLTLGDRFNIYVRSLIGPMAILGPAAGAAVGQARNAPHEWGQGAAGYGRRFGSDMAQRIISHTIVFGVSAADGAYPSYIRSDESGAWNRARHAIIYSFVTRKDGRVVPAYGRFAGDFGAALIVNAWHPPSENSVSHGLYRGTTAFVTHIGLDVLHEFWPDIRRKLHLPQQFDNL
jgi:hypothetical protein